MAWIRHSRKGYTYQEHAFSLDILSAVCFPLTEKIKMLDLLTLIAYFEVDSFLKCSRLSWMSV